MRQKVYERMRCDLGVMAEWGDDEAGLYNEVMTCDEEILEVYCDTWEVEYLVDVDGGQPVSITETVGDDWRKVEP